MSGNQTPRGHSPVISPAPSLRSGEDFRVSLNVEADQIPEYLMKKQCVLFYAPETEELAKKVAAQNSNIELGKCRWRKFADGFPDLFVENATAIRNKHVAFLASFHNPSVIFEQMSVIYALPRLFVGSFTLVLPFFPTGTLERCLLLGTSRNMIAEYPYILTCQVETEGDVATAFTLARILTNVPPSRGGPTSLVIFDIHALQITIAYPDEGAHKRFHLAFKAEGFQEVICTKVRDGAKRIVRVKEGNPAGRHVVIVDDLVQSGGTLIECQSVLAQMGAKHGGWNNQWSFGFDDLVK
ncbi:hypothetical protein CEUSTIGMA_g13560.t1 [Chlamydomonas eustigma]|uniref:Phosphoribosyltransferase domain-containing protein n=1 Tax=Chlamydomonas eustigma TaxID=1157962 RepID=A0A250XSV0_9CHLO|nr:hypothetical protein CEUSTIGMA_g13560.t1 [Chlamydomonas eustigma]|eukprot:GAX86147.1 hypothetical protein CEUSTIGMA_g13560.t1 [Chlamydomonas eustigma]